MSIDLGLYLKLCTLCELDECQWNVVNVNRPRTHTRSKFANIPAITSIPPPPPPPVTMMSSVRAPWSCAGTDNPAASADQPPDVSTRLVGLESRVAVAEKSTRALLVEVVRLQGSLGAAMKSVDDERAARRDAEQRRKAADDALTQLQAQMEQGRDERRRRTEDNEDSVVVNPAVLETARAAQAAALAAREEGLQRAQQQADRYITLSSVTGCHALTNNVTICCIYKLLCQRQSNRPIYDYMRLQSKLPYVHCMKSGARSVVIAEHFRIQPEHCRPINKLTSGAKANV